MSGRWRKTPAATPCATGQGSQGAVAVLERENALEQTTACIGKAEEFRAAIEARKVLIAAQG